MAERKPKWPEAGDQITAAIEAVTDYGAYAKLDGSPKCCVNRYESRWARHFQKGRIIGMATS